MTKINLDKDDIPMGNGPTNSASTGIIGGISSSGGKVVFDKNEFLNAASTLISAEEDLINIINLFKAAKEEISEYWNDSQTAAWIAEQEIFIGILEKVRTVQEELHTKFKTIANKDIG